MQQKHYSVVKKHSSILSEFEEYINCNTCQTMWNFLMFQLGYSVPLQVNSSECNSKYLTGCHLFKYTAILNMALVINSYLD